VEMTNDEEAAKAIEELNNAEFDGKVMTVSEARPKTDRKPGGFGDSRGGGGHSDSRGGGGGYGDKSRGGFKKRF